MCLFNTLELIHTHSFVLVDITKSHSLILLLCNVESAASTNAISFVYSEGRLGSQWWAFKLRGGERNLTGEGKINK